MRVCSFDTVIQFDKMFFYYINTRVTKLQDNFFRIVLKKFLLTRIYVHAFSIGLIPLPFEVHLDDTAQRYPALNIRSGSQEIFADNKDYLKEYDIQEQISEANHDPDRDTSTQFLSRTESPEGRRNHADDTNYHQIYRNHNTHQNFNINEQTSEQLSRPHINNEDEINQHDVTIHNRRDEDDIHNDYESDNIYNDRPYEPEGTSGSYTYERSFNQHGKHRYKKQTNHYGRYISQENLIEDSHQLPRGPTSSNIQQFSTDNYQRRPSYEQENPEYHDVDFAQSSNHVQHRPVYREYDDEYYTEQQQRHRRLRSQEHHLTHNFRRMEDNRNETHDSLDDSIRNHNENNLDDVHYSDFGYHQESSTFVPDDGSEQRNARLRFHRHHHRSPNRHRSSPRRLRHHSSTTTVMPVIYPNSMAFDFGSTEVQQLTENSIL